MYPPDQLKGDDGGKGLAWPGAAPTGASLQLRLMVAASLSRVPPLSPLPGLNISNLASPPTSFPPAPSYLHPRIDLCPCPCSQYLLLRALQELFMHRLLRDIQAPPGHPRPSGSVSPATLPALSLVTLLHLSQTCPCGFCPRPRPACRFLALSQRPLPPGCLGLTK